MVHYETGVVGVIKEYSTYSGFAQEHQMRSQNQISCLGVLAW